MYPAQLPDGDEAGLQKNVLQWLCDLPRVLEEFNAWVERAAAQWDFTTELLKATKLEEKWLRHIKALREDLNQLHALKAMGVFSLGAVVQFVVCE